MVSQWEDEQEGEPDREPDTPDSQQGSSAQNGDITPSSNDDTGRADSRRGKTSSCATSNQSAEKAPRLSTDAHDTLSHGPVRIVTINDGAQECMALVLSKDLIKELNGVLQGLNRLDRLHDNSDNNEVRYNVTETIAEESRGQVSELETALQMAEENSAYDHGKVQKELDGLKESLAELESAQEHNNAMKEEAQQALHFERVMQRSRLDAFLHIMKSAMTDRQLIEDSISVEEDDEGNAGNIYKSSVTGSRAETSLLGLEELSIESTKAEYRTKRNTLKWLQSEFDGRRDKYYQQLAEFGEAKENGECSSLGISEFDRRFVWRSQQLSQALTQAEAEFAEAKAQVLALGIHPVDLAELDSNMTIPESTYSVNEVDDIEEAQAIASVNREYIEFWMQQTKDAGNLGPDQEEDRVADDWDVVSLNPGDSISQVAEPYQREEIDRWRSRCSDLRSSISLDD